MQYPSSSTNQISPQIGYPTSSDIQTPSLGTSIASGRSNPQSPDTNLQTPAHSGKQVGGGWSGSGSGSGTIMDLDPSSSDEAGLSQSFGLGYGDVENNGKGKERALGRDEDIVPQPASITSSPPDAQNQNLEDNLSSEEDKMGFPDIEELRKMQSRLEELQSSPSSDMSESHRGQRVELETMVHTLLTPTMEQLPFLLSQIDAQKATIKTLQQQAKLSEQLSGVERERHAAERRSWQYETTAMIKVRDEEIAAGKRPNRLLDLDVGYHQELEAANKRLEMDNRLMAPRLADTQRQIDKLVNELRHLRSNVVISSGPLKDFDRPLHPPQMPLPGQAGPSRRRSSMSPSRSNINTVMGDARAEHLLLAARKVRAMRQHDDRVGRLTLEELQRNGVVGPDGGVGYSEGYGGLMLGHMAEDDDSDLEEELKEEYIETSQGSGKGKSAAATPLLPRAKRSSKRSLPPPTTPSRSKGHRQAPATTPGGSNFNDLLRAAELATTRPGTPTPGGSMKLPMSTTSNARSTNIAQDDNASDRGSPVKRVRREPPATDWVPRKRAGSTSRAGGVRSQDDFNLEEAGLDLLAQASYLDVAQSKNGSQASTAPLPSASRFGGMLHPQPEAGARGPRSSGGDSGLAPAIDLRDESASQSQLKVEDEQIDPSLMEAQEAGTETPRVGQRSLESTEVQTPARNYNYHSYPGTAGTDLQDSPPLESRNENQIGVFASPTGGGGVPGLGKYVHLSSSMPARRMRSPYLKWTVEEDELLARAVALHGEKWDLVSKGVPTRSYHQVRQRWLRKTGAFDKKPSIDARADEFDDGQGSPTPGSGQRNSKKRKAS